MAFATAAMAAVYSTFRSRSMFWRIRMCQSPTCTTTWNVRTLTTPNTCRKKEDRTPMSTRVRFVLAVVLVVILTSCAPSEPARRIAFLNEDGIVVVTSDTLRRTVAVARSSSFSPVSFRWLPTGTGVVYEADNMTGHDRSLYVKLDESDNPVVIATATDFEYSVSPDGKRVIYRATSLAPNGVVDDRSYMYSIDTLALSPFPIVCMAPSWSPAGDSIACTISVGNVTRVAIFSIDGSSVWVADMAGTMDGIWSPDGTSLAYTRVAHGAFREWWVAGADGSFPHVVSAPMRLTAAPASWSPDGTRLVFVALNGNDIPAATVLTVRSSECEEVRPGSQAIWLSDASLAVLGQEPFGDGWEVRIMKIGDNITFGKQVVTGEMITAIDAVRP